MDSSLNTPKTTKKAKPDSNKKQIRLAYNEDNLFVPADQLIKVPKKEDDTYLAGDLVWVKSKGFPWWPCMLTVDPETGKYSKTIVIRDNNEKVFHVQYFGTRPYRGYSQGLGSISKYEGKDKYELKLDQIKNTPTPNKSQRKKELNDLAIKQSFKKEWIVACTEADDAMKLERSARIEKLTFEYILDKPKSVIKKEKQSIEDKSTPSATKSVAKSSTKSTAKKRKLDDNQVKPSTSKSKTKSNKKKKANADDSKSSPGDVYDFNLFEEEFEEETPKKLFELSSARRAKGEYEIYAKQLRADIEKENPEMDDNEIEQKLKRNWNLMSEDMRNSYAPRPSVHTNLSFQLESPEKKSNSSVLDSTSKQQTKTYSGLKRGRKPAKKENDFEKENALDDELNESDEEEQTATKDEEEDTTDKRRSSRKKLFKQDNDANNESKVQTPSRQSARMRTGKSNTLKTSLSASSTPAKTNATKERTPKRKTSEPNSIKKATNNKQLAKETNGNNDEDSESCSSESEKIEQKDVEAEIEAEGDEKDKEKLCGKCNLTGRGLVKCEGDCLTWYHKDCLYKEEESKESTTAVLAASVEAS